MEISLNLLPFQLMKMVGNPLILLMYSQLGEKIKSFSLLPIRTFSLTSFHIINFICSYARQYLYGKFILDKCPCSNAAKFASFQRKNLSRSKHYSYAQLNKKTENFIIVFLT